MPHRLSFRDDPRRLDGYASSGAGATPFGTVEVGRRGAHEVTVLGDGVPTVHVDDVLLPDGRCRILRRPATITLDGVAGTLSQQRGLRITRAAKAVTAQVAGRTYDLRMTGVSAVAVTRAGHGRIAVQRAASCLLLEERADPTDLAVALALTSAVDRDSLSLLPGT
jgi:hypothetical protein